LQPGASGTDDAAVHPAVAALPFEEKGLVLGALLARTPAEVVGARFSDPAAARCRAALEALGAESRAARAATMAGLMALVRAPWPLGLERVHADWLRERLSRQTSTVIQAVLDALPAEVRRVGQEILRARAEADGTAAAVQPAGPSAGAAELGRVIFAGLVPLAGPGAPIGPVARPLLALSFAELEAALEARGAETLGVSLRGAPGPLVARAAAGVGEALARPLLDAATASGPAEARDAARLLVARATLDKPADLTAYLGARALAPALAGEGREVARAIAQRLPWAPGHRLLAFAGEAAR
jgi:hypothetical protein